MNNLETALYIWAKSCEKNKLTISDWFDEAVVKLATQGGQSIASSSANGVMVTFMTNSTTLLDWVTSLAKVKELLNDSTANKRNKTIAVFR